MNYEPRRKRGNLKLKLLIGVAIVLLLLAALELGLHIIENRMKGEESQYGDTGDWGKHAADADEAETGEEHLITIADKDYIYTDDIRTYLMIGTDATNHASGKTAATTRGEMADFLMLLMINRTQDTYGFIQLNRDTMMDVPVLDETGKFTGFFKEQLCIAHWYGTTPEERNENTVYAVSRLLGDMDIDGYYAINMEDIDALNNAIGGVVVTIKGDLTEVDPEFTDGAEVLLKDGQAEKFLRARMSVGEGTNQERMERQLQYMQSAYSRLINQIRENPNYINDVYNEVSDKVQTDRSTKQLSEFAKYIGRSESQGFLCFTGETKEGDTLDDGILHAEFYTDESSIVRTLSKLIALKEAPAPEE